MRPSLGLNELESSPFTHLIYRTSDSLSHLVTKAPDTPMCTPRDSILKGTIPIPEHNLVQGSLSTTYPLWQELAKLFYNWSESNCLSILGHAVCAATIQLFWASIKATIDVCKQVSTAILQ